MAAIKKKTNKPAMTRNQAKTFTELVKGSEPIWDSSCDINDEYKFDIWIVNTLNWYSYMYNWDESKKWFLSYLKDKGLSFEYKIAKKVSTYELQNVGFFCRMYFQGLPENDKVDNIINKKIKKLKTISDIETEVVNPNDEKPVNNISIQDRIQKTVNQYVGEIWTEIDNVIDNKFKTEFNVYKWLEKNEIKGTISKKIAEELKPEYDEIHQALNGDDPIISESYKFYGKTGLKKLNKLYETIITDCETWAQNKTNTRKPRKKKEVSIVKLVEKLKYKKEHSDYKLVSIQPENIIGSSELWVFNTKTRILQVYRSAVNEGLSIKGTTLINFESSKSIGKRVRENKVSEITQRVINGGVRVLNKIMDEIVAVDTEVNGRINNDVILLKTIKK